jgi:hypothetical protein
MDNFKTLSSDKVLLTRVEDIVRGYQVEIMEFTDLHQNEILAKSAMDAHWLPFSSKDIDLTSGLSVLEKKIIHGLITMM